MAKRVVLPTRVVSLLLACAAFGEPGTSTLKTATPPAWVEPSVNPGAPSKPGQDSTGQLFTLFDTQVNVAEAETYCHIIKEVTSETGVQTGANLTFGWDPSFQELTIHQIT